MPSEEGLVSTDAQDLIEPLLKSSRSSIPFPAQHAILQAIQNHLEDHIFRFLQKWLLAESQAVGWTCVEAIELHNVFGFLADHKERIESQAYCPPAQSIQKWHRVISNIRHASVHRVPQARDIMLRMVRHAIGFVESIAGGRSSRSLRQLYRFVKAILHTSDRLQAQLRDKVRMQVQLCNAHPDHSDADCNYCQRPRKGFLKTSSSAWCPKFKTFCSSSFHKSRQATD